MANTRTQLPFQPEAYKKIKIKHRIEISLRVVFNILGGIGVVTGWTSLSSVLGISLLLGSVLSIGTLIFAAIITATALTAIFWVVNSAISQAEKAKKEIHLMQQCDGLTNQINQLLSSHQMVTENGDEYKSLPAYNSQPLSAGRLFGRITNYFMSFISAFTSTLGLASLICGGLGLGSLLICTGGVGVLVGIGAAALLMGIVAIGTENYFKQNRRNRIHSLREKVGHLSKVKSKIKKTIRKNRILKLENKVKEQDREIASYRLNHFSVFCDNYKNQKFNQKIQQEELTLYPAYKIK